jgi:uncharacterized membrane protein
MHYDEKSMLYTFNKVFVGYRRKLLNTFWFVPSLVSLLGPLLAFLFLELDHNLSLSQEPLIFHGGTAEADTILSTIAGSLITVAGLAFSITIVVLQLVSSQYTPRALRGFLQDRVTQAVAGGFFAIFAFSSHSQRHCCPWSWLLGIGALTHLRSPYGPGDSSLRYCGAPCSTDTSGH